MKMLRLSKVLIHLKMKMLRLSKVLIHLKMKMRRLGKAKDVFIRPFRTLVQECKKYQAASESR